jgi:hypothetical protein
MVLLIAAFIGGRRLRYAASTVLRADAGRTKQVKCALRHTEEVMTGNAPYDAEAACHRGDVFGRAGSMDGDRLGLSHSTLEERANIRPDLGTAGMSSDCPRQEVPDEQREAERRSAPRD